MIQSSPLGFRCQHQHQHHQRRRPSLAAHDTLGPMVPEFSRASRTAIVVIAIALSFCVFYKASDSMRFSFPSSPSIFTSLAPDSEGTGLERVLKNAAMENRTVILTTLNEAWAAPGAVFDLFLESFRIGDRTHQLLNHLVIIALDHNAFTRCLVLHTHCYALVTEGVDFHQEAYFMTPDYLKMMWRRIDFLCSVLEMGYSFLFTDADILWFRDPFPRFYADADFQIACDHFSGDSDDIQNKANGGFMFVKSNNQSIEFYKFWYSSREAYPENHDQDVLNKIKFDPFITDIGLRIKFLDSAYFGGLCEPSKDLNLVCTMHANCCFGLDSKLIDLRVMLQDWRKFMSLSPSLKRSLNFSWNVPQNCSLSSLHHYNSSWESVQHGLVG
ncbi:Nucleotid_trans domain-containing protein [Cephalotus follicularis]|uniref:Nucleotid_trans domain-containing protein n=1 Tax=Cephalotus follicularis TaxID=3775 RepID=A0A1Q3AUL0_CEPFO|nr:Nucleotid_trans domain-containing protein [Cephalotus follicularis]